MRVPLLRPASVAGVIASLLVAGGCRSRGAAPCDAPPACATPPPCAPPPCAPPPTACAPLPCAPEKIVTRVLPGDVLHGRLTCSDGCQCFYFEGVEYSILNFSLKADEKCAVAPQIAIEDPDGRPLALSDDVCAKGCAASAGGLILRRSGTYKATVCKPSGSGEVYYAFTHELRLANPDDRTMWLEAGKTQTITFVAPKGSRCMVEVTPDHACNVTPKFLAVKDPAGGRALAPEAKLDGAPEAWIVGSRGGAKRVDFNAPRSGRYTVVVTAEDCSSGKAVAHVAVHPPGDKRCLYHDDHACPERPTIPPEPVR